MNASVFNARLAQENLIGKQKVLIEKFPQINRNIFLQKMNLELKTFDSSYFRGKSHFEEYYAQNYLVFQPVYRYFKVITGVGNGSHIYHWKSKGLSDEMLIIVLFHTQIIMVLK